MLRTVAPLLLVLACAAALAGCGRSEPSPSPGGNGAGKGVVPIEGADYVDVLVQTLNSFTEELLSKVEKAQDTKAGVAEAQALLDARKEGLASGVAALKRVELNPASRGKWLEAEVDNTRRVHDLQLTHIDASLRDPELKAGLERLAADYDALYQER